MNKTLEIFALVGILVGAMLGQVSAQVVTNTFFATSTGVALTLALNGQSTCSVTVTSIGTGGTIVPEVSTDGTNFVTASGINGGAINAVNTFTGNVSVQAVSTFRLRVSALTSGTVQGTAACTTAPVSVPLVDAFGNKAIFANSSLVATRSYSSNSSGGGCSGVLDSGGGSITRTTTTIQLAAPATNSLVLGAAGSRIHVCSISVSAVLTVASPATLSLTTGTGATCTTGTVTDRAYLLGVGNFVVAEGDGQDGLFDAASTANLCYALGGSTGVVNVSVTTSNY